MCDLPISKRFIVLFSPHRWEEVELKLKRNCLLLFEHNSVYFNHTELALISDHLNNLKAIMVTLVCLVHRFQPPSP